MSTPCPACGEALNIPDSQNYCGTCGEPINRTPDREFIRRDARGFLSRRVRRHLLDTIQGDRDHRSEYTAMKVQEQARQALFDFSLVYGWEGIENHELFLADIDSEPDWDTDDPGEFVLQMTATLQLLSVIYANTSDVLPVLMALSIFLEDDVETGDEIDVRFLVNGERVDATKGFTVPEDWDVN